MITLPDSPNRPPLQAWFSAIWGLLATGAGATVLLVVLFIPSATPGPWQILVWGCFWFALFGIIPMLLGAGVMQLKEVTLVGQRLAILGIVSGILGIATIVVAFILAFSFGSSGSFQAGN